MIDLYRNRHHRRILKRIGDTPDFELELDNSTLTQFNCPRRFMQYAVLGRDSHPSIALVFGNHMHKALEVLHTTQDIHEADHALVTAASEHPLPADEFRDLQFARHVLAQYHSHWSGKLHLGLEVAKDKEGALIVERPFRIPAFSIPVDAHFKFPPHLLIEGSTSDEPEFYVRNLNVYWTGKIDLGVLQDGGFWINYHKTSSTDTENYWRDFDLSPQMTGYVWAAEKLFGRYVAGVIVNVLFLRKITKTGKGSTFERRKYTYRPDQIEDWTHDMKETVFSITEGLVSGFFRKFTPACVGKFQLCPYHIACTKSPAQREIVLGSDLYTDTTWSPLNETLPPPRLEKVVSSPYLPEGESLFNP